MTSIAIDGPSGAGKSTLARAIARALGYIYVDTGALYRAIALAALRAGVHPTDAAGVAALLPNIHLAIRHQGDEQRVFLGEEDVSDAIREERVSMGASDVSAHGAVRQYLLETQRRFARECDVIMDGRDIGTVVLPAADVKIYLTATVAERAARRYAQLLEKGLPASPEQVREDVIRRDYNDSHRAVAPLKRADDAIEVDTTGNTFDQSLSILLGIINKHLAEKGART